jgi:hypothetical protein
MPRFRVPVFSAMLFLVFESCYTRFAEFEPVSARSGADTVQAADMDRETCLWERDLTGLPRLHCYPVYYPRQWYLYNYSPWWYRNGQHLYNAKKCPPYYYLDTSCGCCRYYLNNPDLVRSSGGGVTNKKTDTIPDSNRVSVNVSAGSSVHIPLNGNTAPSAGAPQTPAGQSAFAQSPPDSLAMRHLNDSLARVRMRDTMKVVPVNTLRRSLRGR